MKIVEFVKRNPMLFALAVVVLFFDVWIRFATNTTLFAPRNVTNLIAQNGHIIILATGMLLCILSGGNIDLSIGSMVCLVAALGGTLIVKWDNNVYLGEFILLHGNIYTSIALCLLLGIVLGAIQGYWIAYVRIPAFIVTLAGMLAFRGLANVLLKGLTISPMPRDYNIYLGGLLPVLPAGADTSVRMQTALIAGVAICAVVVILQIYSRFSKLRKSYAVEAPLWLWLRLAVICVAVMGAFYCFGMDRGIPVVLIIAGVVVLAYYYFTSKTVPGRYLYAMGGNEKAAKLSGINTNGVLFFAYTNMGFLAAVAALVCMARFNSAFPDLGRGYELDAIGACFIGGASAYGGIGTVGGTLIGTIFMGILNNGMSILGINVNWQQTVKGAVLLAAVAFDVISKKRKGAA
jgi:putative multiple sugar transport system permease protein